jgi:hypothetical protein
MSEEIDYLISTCFDFGGLDISVIVKHDGFSYWTDQGTARSVVPMIDKNYEIVAAYHTIKAPIPKETLQKIRDELSPLYWSDNPAPDEILDSLLEPIFWEHVASHFGVSR